MNKFCPHCLEGHKTESVTCPDCGKDLVKLTDDSLVGRVLDGRYTVVSEMGRGGMGVVYRARQRYLERDVAIKVLRKDMSADAANVKRFMLEARAASGLKSAHTVTIHEFGVTPDGLMYFAMELLDGEPLNRLIRRLGRVPPQRAALIVSQVCKSLAEAHAGKIYHRDMKPENIFLTRSDDGADHALVLDFGIAKLAEQQSNLTATGMVCGTPAYVSPEQARGKGLDHRTDIYSLGVVLYEMLAGKPPFAAATPMGLVVSHVNRPPARLDQIEPPVDVPPALHELLMSTLAKAADDRPQSAEELGEVVMAAVAERLEAGGWRPEEEQSQDRLEAGGWRPEAESGSLPPASTADDLVLPGPTKSTWVAVGLAAAAVVIGMALWQPWASSELDSLNDAGTVLAVDVPTPDVRGTVLDGGGTVLDVQPLRFDIQPPSSDVQPLRSEIQLPERDIQLPEPDIWPPEPDMQLPRPDIRGPKPDIRKPKSRVRDPKVESGGSKAEIRSPKAGDPEPVEPAEKGEPGDESDAGDYVTIPINEDKREDGGVDEYIKIP